jgi:WD40 repeat protein
VRAALLIALVMIAAACGPSIPPTPTRGPLPTLAPGVRLRPGEPITVENAPRLASLGNLIGHDATVNQIAFAPNGRWMATRDGAGDALLWDLDADSRPRTLGREDVSHVFFIGAGESLVTVSPQNGLRFYEAETGQMQSSAPGNPDQTVTAMLSADNLLLATGGIGGDVIAWDLGTRQPMWRTPATASAGGGSVRALAFSPDGTRLAGLLNASDGIVLTVWDTASGDPVASQTYSGQVQPWSLLYSPDGAALALAFGGEVRLLDNASLSVRYTLTSPDLAADRAIAFSPDGRYFASTGTSDVVYVWTASDGKAAAGLQGQQGAAMRLSFSPNSALLLTTNARPAAGASVWPTEAFIPDATAYPHGRIAREGSGILEGEWSPDGRMIALAEGSGTVMLLGIPLE